MPSAQRHPSSVFVSYSHEDTWFVDLMVELLSFHRIRPWHDRRDVGAAHLISDKVREGIRSTESMIVVLSPHALQSRWVHKELFAFASVHGTETIFPVKLRDFADNDGVFHELHDRQAINFSGNMLEGFRDLTQAFGKPFLPPVEQRKAQEDRRRSSVEQRLAFDFRQTLARFPDVHRNEPRGYAAHGQLFVDIVEAFHETLYTRYTVLDRRTREPVTMPAALFERLILQSEDHFDALERLVPDFFVTAVVRQLTQLFKLEPVQRRQAKR
jgi:hypothetical protein